MDLSGYPQRWGESVRESGCPVKELSTYKWADCLSPADTENIAQEGVGRSGEVDARGRDTRMRGINGDDGLIELEITILVIDEGRPVGSNVGATDRPAKHRLRVQAPPGRCTSQNCCS